MTDDIAWMTDPLTGQPVRVATGALSPDMAQRARSMAQPGFLDRAKGFANAATDLMPIKMAANATGLDLGRAAKEAALGMAPMGTGAAIDVARGLATPEGREKAADALEAIGYRTAQLGNKLMPSLVSTPQKPASMTAREKADAEREAKLRGVDGPDSVDPSQSTAGTPAPQQAPMGDGSMSMRASLPMGGRGGVGRTNLGADKAFEAAEQRRLEAAQSAYDAGIERANVEAGYWEQQRQNQAQQQMGMLELEERQRAEKAAADAEYRRAEEEVAGARIDPNRYYADMNTGQKFVAAIGLALGALGGAATGGRNSAVEAINHAIQTDIDAQKAMIAKKERGLARKQTLYGQMLERFGDERRAELATYDLMYKQAESAFQGAMAKTGVAANRAKLAEAAAGVADARTGYLAQREQYEQDRAFKNAQLGLQQAELGMRWQEAQAKASGGPDMALVVPGVGVATSKEAAKEVAEASEARANIKAQTQKLRELREKHGAEWFNTAGAKEMKSAQAELMTSMLRLKKLGSLDKGSQEVLAQLAGGDPTSTFFNTRVLDQVDQAADSTFTNTISPRLQQRFAQQPNASYSPPGWADKK